MRELEVVGHFKSGHCSTCPLCLEINEFHDPKAGLTRVEIDFVLARFTAHLYNQMDVQKTLKMEAHWIPTPIST